MIYNLPFTVSKRGRPAETAFTDRDPDRRAIYLVPDHTATRIMKDSSYHLDGIHMLQSMKSISKELAERWESEISKLNTGERVAASIIHEYGHILTFRAWGNMGIKNTLDVYDWLDEYGYLDNFSKRIVSFNEGDAPWQINVAIEQLAEDFRLALDVKNQNGACCLPHIITYQQDLLNPEGYLEGVDIMKNLLQFDGKLKKGRVSGALDSIIPFGEANRSSLPTNFIHGEITPLTQEDKDRAREKLKQFEVDF